MTPLRDPRFRLLWAVGIAPTLYGAALVIVVPCLAVLLLPDVRRLGLADEERRRKIGVAA